MAYGQEHKVREVNGVKVVGEGVGFERIRRITGYLVGDLNRFTMPKDRKYRIESHIQAAADSSCGCQKRETV